jgi:L-amino acid N-acyltransferase YncA
MSSQVRIARLEDAAAIAAIYAPYVRETAITFELDVPNDDEMRRRIADVLSYSTYLVCERDGAIAGYAYGARFRTRAAYQWASETTVYVDHTRHGRGTGRALYTSLMNCLRVQGFTVAVGVIGLPNKASVELHERMGFKLIGNSRATGFKLGRWHDVGWYELALVPPPQNPQTPRTLEALSGDAAFQSAIQSGLNFLKP